MARINEHYLNLAGGYLFPEIERRVTAYLDAHPEAHARLVRCGVGDVTEPLPAAARDAMHAAVDELGDHETFCGYGPPFGYDFLRQAIVEHDFAAFGLPISTDEIFVSDGSKGDAAAVLDILGPGNRIAVTDPVYPVYVDTNVMRGHTRAIQSNGQYEGLVYLPCTPANGFVPDIPEFPLDVVYLCYPNNPTGGMMTREKLAEWVAYAREHDALILYDVAYQAYIQDLKLPRSIYEIDGATECAMEFHSFSKNGGFTGTRCGYTVCPKALKGTTSAGDRTALHDLWSRRWATKSNGVSYVVQRGAAALYSEAGQDQVNALVDGYMRNARLLREGCQQMNLRVYGGEHAPYVWVQCPDGVDSWQMFDRMLQELQVVITPGSGFGVGGAGYFRISAFNSLANVEEVVRRMRTMNVMAAS